MRAGAYDMPMQLQFDYRFSRAMQLQFDYRFSQATLEADVHNQVFLLHKCKVSLSKSEIRLEVFSFDVPTSSSTVNKATNAANERLAHKVWSKCSTKDRET
jgi:hypothetical protein